MLKILKKLYIMNMFPKSEQNNAHVVRFDYNIINDFLHISFKESTFRHQKRPHKTVYLYIRAILYFHLLKTMIKIFK